MKEVTLKKDCLKKLERGTVEFYSRDIEQSLSQFLPGEWVYVRPSFIGIVNPFVEKAAQLKIVSKCHNMDLTGENENELALKIIFQNIDKAILKRSYFKDQLDGARLVFGQFDELPGLIVDKYEEIILLQITSAGMDRFRNEIKNHISEKFSKSKIVFFDNPKKRSLEGLPIFEENELEKINDISIRDNGFKFEIPTSILQKNGFYFDHSQNRKKLENNINNLNLTFENGLDLFSYCGSWGFHLLRAGVKNVTFVDQSPIVETISDNFRNNNLEGSIETHRDDVFKYLDKCKKDGLKYDVIVSDPPAFSKSREKKSSAMSGYDKIHHKCVGLLNSPSLFAVGSCTKNIDFMDLDKSVKKAFYSHNRKAQMIDIGVQRADHPFTDFLDNGFYIKFILYLVN